MGVYHIGVMSCLKENAAGFLQRVKCFGGASAGAFAAVGLVMDLDISEVAESVIKLSTRANSLSFGPLDPSFQIVKTVERAFDKMLPENAHEIASGKLHISLTRVPDLKNVIVSKFFSKEDLIEVSYFRILRAGTKYIKSNHNNKISTCFTLYNDYQLFNNEFRN